MRLEVEEQLLSDTIIVLQDLVPSEEDQPERYQDWGFDKPAGPGLGGWEGRLYRLEEACEGPG